MGVKCLVFQVWRTNSGQIQYFVKNLAESTTFYYCLTPLNFISLCNILGCPLLKYGSLEKTHLIGEKIKLSILIFRGA